MNEKEITIMELTNETTYQTKINNVKTDIILPIQHDIDIVIQQQRKQISEQKQLETKYHKYDLILSICYCLMACINVLIMGYSVLYNNTITFTIAIICLILALFLAERTHACNNKEWSYKYDKKIASRQQAYLNMLSKIHHLFSHNKVIKITLNTDSRYIVYADENGNVKHMSLRFLNDLEYHDVETQWGDDVKYECTRNTKITTPRLVFKLTYPQITYMTPYKES